MKTKKRFPAYDIKSPKYPSLPSLYDNLAFQDASFQGNQIILEFFDDHITDNKINGKELIRELSSKYKISAGTEDLSRIKEMMAESYIVQTYNIAELFFKEFNKTYKQIHNISTWKTTIKIGKSDKKLDPLNQLLNNLTADKKKNLKRLPEFLLADYYRLLRNGYVHREIKKNVSLKKPKEYFEKHINSTIYHFQKYYKSIPKTGNLAPNLPEKLNHRDFVLYSRILRNLANYLNELCPLSVEQAFELSEKDSKFFNTPKKINYHEFPNAKPKLDTYLKNYYKSNFGNDMIQIERFIEIFYSKY
tara:strand:- start:148 stop:1059 length:912 start_codon:yes stop_codon:yes gene_type:complete